MNQTTSFAQGAGPVGRPLASHHRRDALPRAAFEAVLAVVMPGKGKPRKRRGARLRPAPGRRGIVEEIVVYLGPWKRGKSDAAITADVTNDLDVMLKLIPLQERLFDMRANREHGKKLDEALGKVETLLRSAPGALAWLLFDPLPPVQFTDDYRFPLEQPMPYKSIEDIERAYEARAGAFIADKKPTGTEHAAFRTVASLLYEAVSGQQGCDLKRACDKVLRDEPW